MFTKQDFPERKLNLSYGDCVAYEQKVGRNSISVPDVIFT